MTSFSCAWKSYARDGSLTRRSRAKEWKSFFRMKAEASAKAAVSRFGPLTSNLPDTWQRRLRPNIKHQIRQWTESPWRTPNVKHPTFADASLVRTDPFF